MQNEKILYFQNLCCEQDDVYTEEHVEFLKEPISKFHSQFIETRTHIFDKNSSLQISTLDDYNNNYAYHNLKIVSDLNCIEKIEFYIGESLIEQSYPSLLKNYTPFTFLQEHIIPA